MNTLQFYLHYAFRSLWRGKQRTFLAVICVAFGVMSLLAMQVLADVVGDAVLVNPQVQLDGDLVAYGPQLYLTDENIEWLDTLVETDQVERYCLTASYNGLILQRPDSGKVQFVMRGLGVDPAVYPLIGEVVLMEPVGASLADVIAEPGTVAITRDLARETAVKVGDSVRVTIEIGGIPTLVRVAGIISELPDHEGSKLIYNFATAAQIAGTDWPVDAVSLQRGPVGNLEETLAAAGWAIRTPSDLNTTIADVFSLMLRGAGILGLLVGGVGVVNTMQVSLTRRKTEIAMLKTLGYRQRDLLVLFGLEAALLGLLGSLLGMIAALFLAERLVRVFERIGFLLIVWKVNPLLLAGGVFTGILTTVIFAVFVVVRSSSVRPAVLLNQRPVRRTLSDHLRTGLLFLLLTCLFSILSSAIMGSVLEGIGVVLLAIAGFLVLGFLVWGALAIFVRLPLPGTKLIHMSRNNLKRGQLRAVTAAIALFVGVFAIGFAVVVLVDGQHKFAERTLSQEGFNIAIVTDDSQQDNVQTWLIERGIEQVYQRYQVGIEDAALTDLAGNTIPITENMLEAWNTAPESVLDIAGHPFGSMTEGVYLPGRMKTDELLAAVTSENPPQVRLTLDSDEVYTLPLIGFYTWQYTNGMVAFTRGPVVTAETFRTLYTGQTVATTIMAAVPPAELAAFTAEVGQQLPETMTFNATDLNNLLNLMFHNLFIFVVSIAGLALLAGAVLIANSVGLALMERTHEIGVLKAVGFASSHVLRTILYEQGLLALLSGFIGMGAVALTVEIVNVIEPDAGLTFRLLPSFCVVLFAILLTFGSTMLTAWKSVHVRPLEILRAE